MSATFLVILGALTSAIQELDLTDMMIYSRHQLCSSPPRPEETAQGGPSAFSHWVFAEAAALQERAALASPTMREIEEKKPKSELPETGLESEKPKRDIVPGLPATSCIARLAKPLFKAIDRPWKVSPRTEGLL